MVYAQSDPFEYIPKPVPSDVTPETNFIITPVGWVVLIMNVVLIAVISLATISLIVSGIRYVLARGDFKAVATAKTSLTYSIVALIGGIAVLGITRAIINAVGIQYAGFALFNYLGL